MLRQMNGQLKPAGVLIPLLQRPAELTVLLTQRSSELRHHAGQVSFPGGSMEAHDIDVAATALRETHEEVGIAPQHVCVAGYIRTMPTITGFAVTPVVGLVRDGLQLSIDQAEVEYVFEVPLSFLLDSRNDQIVERKIDGETVPMLEFHWQSERIWGATAYMILAFRNKLLNQ